MSDATFFRMKWNRRYSSHTKDMYIFLFRLIHFLFSFLSSIHYRFSIRDGNKVRQWRSPCDPDCAIHLSQDIDLERIPPALHNWRETRRRGRWVRGEKDKRGREKRQAAEGRPLGGQTTLKHGQEMTSRLESSPSPCDQHWLRFRHRQNIQANRKVRLNVSLRSFSHGECDANSGSQYSFINGKVFMNFKPPQGEGTRAPISFSRKRCVSLADKLRRWASRPSLRVCWGPWAWWRRACCGWAGW